MVILHIAAISDDLCSGVCVVVPQHVRAQSEYAQVALINVKNISIPDMTQQISYKKPFQLSQLKEPFHHPDIVVFHETYRMEYLSISRALRKEHIPYIIIPHGELGRGAQKKKRLKKTIANIFLFNSFINHASAIQCLSQTEYDNTFFGKEKFIGTNGVTIPLKRKEHFHRNAVKLVYIGRLDAYHKGLDLMLEAVKRKADFLREHSCSLSMYGPDIYGRFAHISQLIEEKNIGDIVILNHEIGGQDKEKILLEGDIFLQTSRFEGMPLGILEALSYGIPCLVTKGTNLGEGIEQSDSGWVAETDAQSIADKLVEAVLEKETWNQKGKNGLQFVRESFSWQHIADETVEMYKRYVV